MLLIHPPRSAPDSWHSKQAENAECSSCDEDATARLVGKSVKRRNNTSLANVRCCVAQMPEIKMRDRKQGYREESGEQNRNMVEREWGEERRSERWNKCVRFERQWAEHALKEMPLPPSLLPCTHKQIHTNRNALPLHCQHSTGQACTESHWIANGEREDGWTRRNQAGSMSQQHREHVLTEPYTTFMLLDRLRSGSSTVHTTVWKREAF